MSKKKQYKNVIGLIHPDSSWHKDSTELCGQEIIVNTLTECTTIRGIKTKDRWYSASVRLVNPPEGWEGVANSMCLHGFRPRRVLVK